MKKIILLLNLYSIFCNNVFALQIESMSGDDVHGALVNSELIFGKQSALLIDTQVTVNNANKVVARIKKSGKKLTTVFITHAHPDHYLGAAIIKANFPDAKFIAKKSVADSIANTGENLRQIFIKILADAKADDSIADSIVIPEVVTGSSLSFEGNSIDLIDLDHGESETATMLFLPALKTLIAGDLFYNGGHLWLHGCDFDNWIKNLDKISSQPGIRSVYPGHGKVSDLSLAETDKKYISDFKQAIATSKEPQDAIQQMKSLYPDYQMLRSLTLSMNKCFKRQDNVLSR